MPNTFFAEVLEGLTTAVIWVNSDEKIRFMNVAAGEIFQVSPSRMSGIHWQTLLPGLVEELDMTLDKRVTIHEYTVSIQGLDKLRVSCTISPYELDQQMGWLFEVYN
ncbi:MAG TPA: two-component sensor histidine kinase, partial [Thiomicrospira sp.]|nr:two-component sensor histidine kinase [Thiomicrospira sp.]